MVQLLRALVNRSHWRPKTGCSAPRLMCTMLLLCSLEVRAAEWELVSGLVLAVPDNLELSIHPSDRLGGRMLIQGDLSGKPGYFGAGMVIRKLESDLALWKRLEAKLDDRSHRGDLRLVQQGHFTTEQSLPVHYRVYRYSDGKRWRQQLYFLVRNQNRAYWVYWVAVPPVDMDTVLPLARFLMTRVRIRPE